MASTGYAAVWQDGGPALAGLVQLERSALVFEGAGAGLSAARRIAYPDIASLGFGRSRGDRVGGRAALVLDLVDGERIRIATQELGALHELAEAVKLRGGAPAAEASGQKPQRDVPFVHDRPVLG